MKKIDISNIIDNSKFNKFFLAVIVISIFITIADGYDIVVYGTTLPLIMKDLGLNPTQAGLIASSGLFGMIIGAIIFGMLADKIGRKMGIILGILFYTIFTGLSGFASGINVFVALRFLAGMGMASVIVLTTAVVSEYSPKSNRNLLVMMNNMGTGVGQILCTIIGIVLLQHYSWNTMYWLVFIQLLLPVIIYLFYPESPIFYLKHHQIDRLKNVLVRVNPDFKPAEDDEYTVSVFDQTRATITSLFQNGLARNTILIWIIFFCNMYLTFGITTWFPKIMTMIGYSFKSGLVFTLVYFLGGLIGAPVAGVLADKIGLKKIMIFVYIASAILLNIITIKFNPNLFIVILFITGAFLNLPNLVTLTFTAQNYPLSIRGTGLGWGTGIGRLGSVLAPTIVGILIATQVPVKIVFSTFAIPSLIAALSVALTREPVSRNNTVISQPAKINS